MYTQLSKRSFTPSAPQGCSRLVSFTMTRLFTTIVLVGFHFFDISRCQEFQRRKISKTRGAPIEAYYATSQEIEEILGEVNTLRNNIEQNSPNMRCLTYSNILASEAYAAAKRCDGYRDAPTYSVDGYEKVAQSVLVMRQSSKPDYQTALDAWYLQYGDFDLESATCAPEEDHGYCQDYLNMMYADTDQIGCAMSKCEDVESVNGATGYVVVCFFGIAYDSATYGGKPFPYGNAGPCSSCPSSKPECSAQYRRLCCESNSTSKTTTTAPTIPTTYDTSTAISPTTTMAPASSRSSNSTSSNNSLTTTTPTTMTMSNATKSSVRSCEDDAGVRCTQTTCRQQPGIYLKKCKMTCDNCNGSQCYDSGLFNCGYYKTSGLCERERYAMIRFCPKTCELCPELTSGQKGGGK